MLKDVCNCEFTNVFKIEVDFDADPIWCSVCGWNLDLDDFPLSDDLKDDLFLWTKQYKKIPENKHDEIGQSLSERVKKELGSEYKIAFIPQHS